MAEIQVEAKISYSLIPFVFPKIIKSNMIKLLHIHDTIGLFLYCYESVKGIINRFG